VIEANRAPQPAPAPEAPRHPEPAPSAPPANTRPAPQSAANGGVAEPVTVPPIPDDPGIEDPEPAAPDRLRLQ
jgi:HemY protein